MKIAHILGNQIVPPQPDKAAIPGSVRAALEIARAQSMDQNHQVFVLTTGDKPRRTHWQGVELITLRYQAWAKSRRGIELDFREHLPFMIWTQMHRPDVVHGHGYFYLRFLQAKRRIAHFHGDPFPNRLLKADETLRSLSKADFQTIAQHSDVQIAVSNYVSAQVQKGIGQYCHIPVVHNGVDMVHFRPKTPTLFRQEHAIPQDAILFLLVGALVPVKGALQLAHAFTHLLAHHANAHLALAGSSALWNSATQTRTDHYEATVRQALPPENVHILGNVSTSDLPALYAAADVLVVPSVIAEGLSLAALEGMASGLPVIASCAGGLLDIVDETCGILIEPANEQQLFDAMQIVLTDSSLRTRLGEGAYKKVQQFTWEKAAEQLEKIYTK